MNAHMTWKRVAAAAVVGATMTAASLLAAMPAGAIPANAAGTVSKASGTVTISAFNGHSNSVAVISSNGMLVFLDSAGPLVASTGCANTTVGSNAGAVTCGGGVSIVRANLGDLGDFFQAWETGVFLEIRGGSGDDTLWGNPSHGALFGDAGNDFLVGMDGSDQIVGGDGTDHTSYGSYPSTSTSGVTVDTTGSGSDGHFMEGDSVAADVEILVGTNYDDVLVGSDVDNQIVGLGGNDILKGNAGNDKLYGEAGTDSLDGGHGHDGGDNVLRSETGVSIEYAVSL